MTICLSQLKLYAEVIHEMARQSMREWYYTEAEERYGKAAPRIMLRV